MISARMINDEAIEAAAQDLCSASWGSLGGGFLLYSDLLDGGAWYSFSTVRRMSDWVLDGCIPVHVPAHSLSLDDARHLVRASIPGRACRGCGQAFSATDESPFWCGSCDTDDDDYEETT